MRHFSSPHFQNHHSFVYICQMNLLLKYLFYDWPKINEHVFLKFKCTCTSYIHVDIDMLPDLQGTDNVYFGQDIPNANSSIVISLFLFVHVCIMHWKVISMHGCIATWNPQLMHGAVPSVKYIITLIIQILKSLCLSYSKPYPTSIEPVLYNNMSRVLVCRPCIIHVTI